MITWNCFENCSSLTSISIPNSVSFISDGAFKNCSSLTSIYIPNSVTIIGEAFIGCKKLTTVTISETVEYIGNNAFAQCENIEDVFCFAEKLPKTETSAFDKSYPEYATLHVPAVAISKYKPTAPWSSFGIIVALSDGDEPVVPEKKCAIGTCPSST